MIFQTSEAHLVYSNLKKSSNMMEKISKTQILGTHMLIGELPIWGVIIGRSDTDPI